MSDATMSLLKGAKKQSVANEMDDTPQTATVTASEPDDQTEEIQIEKMTVAQLDALVKDNELEVPDNWSKMVKADKVKYLTERYGGDDESGEAADDATAGTGEAVDITGAPDEDDEPASKPATTAVAKTEKKSEAKALAKTIVGKHVDAEVLEPDDISKTVHEIENLKEANAKDLAKSLQENTNFSFFKMGGVLSMISANEWYKPYSTFKEYVVTELGMDYRRAAYWISIYNGIIDSGIPWEKVKAVGWTKLKEIVPVPLTPDNVDHWVEVCQKENTQTLIEMVKTAKAMASGVGLESADQKAKIVTTMSFKVHSDQKEIIETALDKAKEDGQTDIATVALEYICGEYLSGNAKPIHQRLKEAGVDKALEALEKAFPDIDFAVAPKA